MTGMESAPETGLGMTGSWQAGGFLRGTRCEAVVYGDNRTGAVDSYTVTDADGVGRSDLEADYILDVYVLDGAEQLPRTPGAVRSRRKRSFGGGMSA